MGKIIAVMGAGGKTTTMEALGKALGGKRVLLTTTTHIFPIRPPKCRELLLDPEEDRLLQALSEHGAVCAGSDAGRNKLGSLPDALMQKAAQNAEITVCEADGANMHPAKLHRAGEPVIPEGTDRCVIVMGLSALNWPVSQVIHRYGLNPRWEGNPDQLTGCEELLTCVQESISASHMEQKQIKILLNQTDAVTDPEQAEKILRTLEREGWDCRAGSMACYPEPLTDWILSE